MDQSPEQTAQDQLEAATQDRPEEAAPAQPEAPAPARTPFQALFFIALALAVGLAAACGMLCLQQRAAAARAQELEQRAAQLSQEAAGLRTLADQRQTELARREQELAQAQDTIGLLEEYSVAAPDGTVPEYTRLYPDFYAPEWEGETVTGGKVCFLTFDDGPSANTDRVLDTLDRYGVKGTFFVVGASAASAAGQARMRRIVEGGHTIAMHSWSHDYKKVYGSVEGFLEEFSRLYEYIHEVTGVYPSVYRFPGGSINGYNRGVYQEIIAEMTRRGFAYYDWNASAQDATVSPRPSWDIASDCLRGIGRELVVVLAHDSGARGTTVDALPAIIEGYRNAGYTFSGLHLGVEQVTFGYPKAR